MKVIIDLIEDIREQIGNHPEFLLYAMLLKVDASDPARLVYAGEAALNSFTLDELSRKLMINIDASKAVLSVGELIKHILIYDMDKMMYEVKLDIKHQYSSVEVIGFGKSLEEKRYFFFIMLD